MADDAQIYPLYIQPRIVEALADIPVILLSGPRQAGKTTLVRQFCFDHRKQECSLAMKPKNSLACHCEARSDVAIQRLDQTGISGLLRGVYALQGARNDNLFGDFLLGYPG